jgi:cell division protein FtsI (penicillin-binding protein 3)
LPTFNPNDLTGSNSATRRNRVVSDQVEPGSTFKTVVISGALNDGTVTLGEKFDCENGRFVYCGTTLGDHERYGVLTVEDIIMHSSNIGAAKVGIKMGPQRLYHYMCAYGFGAKTGIPLMAEAKGTVRPLANWSKVSISHIPMGHEVAVTPLQMTMPIAAVANKGRLMRPMLVDRYEDEDGTVMFKSYPQTLRQVINEPAARLMVEALKTVLSTNGTGRKAMLEHYTAAGKTGTAQKLVDRKYSHTKHYSSFIGFFPADEPEICIGIFMDEPKKGDYGGEAAGPVFRDVAERVGKYLAIPSDIQPPMSIVGKDSGPGPVAAIKREETR